YLPAALQEKIRTTIEAAGDRATAEAPLAWLSYESDDDHPGVVAARLRLWPGGEERLLGTGRQPRHQVPGLGWSARRGGHGAGRGGRLPGGRGPRQALRRVEADAGLVKHRKPHADLEHPLGHRPIVGNLEQPVAGLGPDEPEPAVDQRCLRPPPILLGWEGAD